MTINVHAEGEGWPKEITYGDFTFTITGIALDFYEINLVNSFFYTYIRVNI